MLTTIVLAIAILLLAILYSSVGHAGASGYLAAMALVGLAPEEMRPTALVLNVFVASIGTYRFAKAGHFSWATLWPFVVASIPLAVVGGWIDLPGYIYKPLVGLVLVWAGYNLIRRYFKSRVPTPEPAAARSPGMPSVPIALLVGAILGLLAGLTGTGGGIFLSPLLILLAWASPKRTAAVSVVFVGLNSIAGLVGFVWSHAESFTAEHLYGLHALPDEIPYYVLAAIVGGVIGSGFGAKKVSADGLRGLLGVVLLIAALKMFMTTLDDLPRADENAPSSDGAVGVRQMFDQPPGAGTGPGTIAAGVGVSVAGTAFSRSSRPRRIELKSPPEMT